MNNKKFDLETYFLPFAQALLSCLSRETLVLAIDGSTVGRGCMALVVSVVYKQRALPTAWLVVKGKKGHLPEAEHIKILQQVHPLIPKGAKVVLVGDGELDGINLQAVIKNWKWHYACRTASNITLYWEDGHFVFQDMGNHTSPGEIFNAPGCKFTQKKYGPVLALCWWRKVHVGLAAQAPRRRRPVTSTWGGPLAVPSTWPSAIRPIGTSCLLLLLLTFCSTFRSIIGGTIWASY
ncbi:hypothetical protein [Desulforhabdus sp. TSK]|uniref:hypothetical protein n=1 Tax=Desulforhabdus sp. TSK TaxID=2925014 RepID=UPI001FC7E0E7|nr:hypothetical protein [Desulforhabdus sp. TSK]